MSALQLSPLEVKLKKIEECYNSFCERREELRSFYNSHKHSVNKKKADKLHQISLKLYSLISEIEKSYDKLIYTSQSIYDNEEQQRECQEKIFILSHKYIEKTIQLEQLANKHQSFNEKIKDIYRRIEEEVQIDISSRKAKIKQLHSDRNAARKKLKDFHPQQEHPSLEEYKQKVYYALTSRTSKIPCGAHSVSSWMSADESSTFHVIINDIFNLNDEMLIHEAYTETSTKILFQRKCDENYHLNGLDIDYISEYFEYNEEVTPIKISIIAIQEEVAQMKQISDKLRSQCSVMGYTVETRYENLIKSFNIFDTLVKALYKTYYA